MASYIPPLGGTVLTGPVEDWEHPDGIWSDGFGVELERASAERRPVACPICGEPNDTVTMDAIAGEQTSPEGFAEFAGHLGTLIRLGSCGHTIKR
ncbi:hypothetical protein ACIHCX_03610 [Streptomyces sp. NPDC052043]|uniref:hypothetical protein n=1 Tax=Streptomyces sp. NPDC052043 TaxID=3365684 RepID=UPI0037D81EB4